MPSPTPTCRGVRRGPHHPGRTHPLLLSQLRAVHGPAIPCRTASTAANASSCRAGLLTNSNNCIGFLQSGISEKRYVLCNKHTIEVCVSCCPGTSVLIVAHLTLSFFLCRSKSYAQARLRAHFCMKADYSSAILVAWRNKMEQKSPQ